MSTVFLTDTPPLGSMTVHVRHPGDWPSGQTMHVPDAFADELRQLVIDLEWALIFSADNRPFALAGIGSELRAAAKQARKIAEMCEDFAKSADEMKEGATA